MTNKELEIKKELEGIELQDNELEGVAGGKDYICHQPLKDQQMFDTDNAKENLGSYAPIIS